jgi:hypothetical protein
MVKFDEDYGGRCTHGTGESHAKYWEYASNESIESPHLTYTGLC